MGAMGFRFLSSSSPSRCPAVSGNPAVWAWLALAAALGYAGHRRGLLDKAAQLWLRIWVFAASTAKKPTLRSSQSEFFHPGGEGARFDAQHLRGAAATIDLPARFVEGRDDIGAFSFP